MTTALATRELILDAEFDRIRFEGRIEDGHLVLDGVLADQERLDAMPVGIYVMERDGTVVACASPGRGRSGVARGRLSRPETRHTT
jgi:hypothetical protein